MRRTPPAAVTTALTAAVAALLLEIDLAPAQTKGGGDMQGMREMMQHMMAERLPPGLDPALLPEPQSQGARALQRYCVQCHNLPGPGMHTAGEWPAVLRRMEMHMSMHNRMMGGVDVPDAIEIDEVLIYLQANAQQPIDPGHPGLDTAVGRTFRATCAQCHALPDPLQHTAAEWPAVVARMQRHMVAMRRPKTDPEVIPMVVEFLQEHARTSDATGQGPKSNN